MEGAYIRSAQDVLGHFKVAEQSGLSAKAVLANREKYGENCERNTAPSCTRSQTTDYVNSNS